MPQMTHCLVIIAHKSEVLVLTTAINLLTRCSSRDRNRLLTKEQATHLCHQTRQVNSNHTIIEPKATIEGRKAYRALGPIIKTELLRVELELPPLGEYKCPGQSAYL